MKKEKWYMLTSCEAIEKRSKEKGFTLIEAMIGIFVFTVGILAVMSVQNASLSSNSMARGTTEGAAFAADVIETLRTMDYGIDSELTDGTHAPPASDRYSISYAIERDAIIDNTMLISVTISWMEGGTPKSLTLDYIKPDNI